MNNPTQNKDLTGIWSGDLEILRRGQLKHAYGTNIPTWLCLCHKCGKTKEIEERSLLNGTAKTCGCGWKRNDLVGQTFGHLRVVALSDKRNNHGTRYWECICLACGKTCYVQTSTLHRTKDPSCGCLQYPDLTGRRFGKLVVLSKTDDRHRNNVVYRCRCDCGNEKEIPSTMLTSKGVKSCGSCNESTSRSKHRSKLKSVYYSMRSRCYNPNDASYKHYGEKGVTISKEWDTFERFETWALSHGYEDGLTIDRIDTSGIYSPDNCRWVGYVVQNNNTSRNTRTICSGVDMTLSEIARLYDVSYQNLVNLFKQNKHTAQEILFYLKQGRYPMYDPYPNCVYLHGLYIPNTGDGSDAALIVVKDVTTLETKIQIIDRPKYRVWVTKPGLRSFTDKRECCRQSECDMYLCSYQTRGEVIAKALGKYRPGAYINIWKLLESPYVWGADMPVLNLIKMEYQQSCPRSIPNVRVGAFDIETSVIGDEQILCASFTDFAEKTTHSFYLTSWLPDDKQKLNEIWTTEAMNFKNNLNAKAQRYFDPTTWKIVYHPCDTERDLIIDAVTTVSSSECDFVGVWNMGFDIGYIDKRCKFRNINPADIYAHPSVPSKYRVYKWVEDTRRVEHLADKWHVLETSSKCKWYDPMCLYGRLRKVKGREVMYTLDYISGKVIGVGKMKFGQESKTHYLMQTSESEKYRYVIYNCFDTINPTIMDAVTSDVMSMIMLLGPALFADFAHQTVQLKAQFYEYCLSKGSVPGTISGSMAKGYDKLISNVGGTVLSPSLMRYKGSRCMQESDDPTGIYRLCCDLDVTSFYPSLTIAMNISRETKEATVLWITGCPHSIEELQRMQEEISLLPQKEKTKAEKKYDNVVKQNAEYIFEFFSRYPAVTENAVKLCEQHFNIPGYDEMLQIFTEQHHLELDLKTVQIPINRVSMDTSK